MEEYYISKKYYKVSVIKFIIFIVLGFISLQGIKLTHDQLGELLFVILSLYFFINSIPNIYRFIYIKTKPDKLLTIYGDAIIIYTKKDKIILETRNFIGYKKSYNSLLKKFQTSHGNIKLFDQTKSKPYHVKYVENINALCFFLDIIQTQHINKKYNK